MNKPAIALAMVALVAGGGYVVYRTRSSPHPAGGTLAPAAQLAPAAGKAPVAPIAAPPEGGSPNEPQGPNLVAIAAGGRVEQVTSEADSDTGKWSAVHAIDHRPATEAAWASKQGLPFPQDVVFSFYDRQPALVGAVAINPQAPGPSYRWAKDIEVWTSMEGPGTGFTKAASLTLRAEPVDQAVTFPAVEARYVKIRVLSDQGNDQGYGAELGKVKVLEATRPGYVALLSRKPELAAALAQASTGPSQGPAAAPAAPGLPSGDLCSGTAPAQTTSTPAPAHVESTNVLLVTRSEKNYVPVAYKANPSREQPEPVYGQLTFTRVLPEEATPLLLLPRRAFDTVVLSQVCDIRDSVTPDFKRALVDWVAAGHKLIIHDSDDCGGKDRVAPDYSFLPYRFATSNPGAQGARGSQLMFVEENPIANGKTDDPGFVDIPAWIAGDNELGDSNIVTKYDPRWCGHLFGTNDLKMNGFVEAYAHHGRGLIIYDGLDNDQAGTPQYRSIVTRELAQSFDPDGLPCGARLSDFVVATEPGLTRQTLTPGHAYTYPLALLSNQGYKGTIKLTLDVQPADPAVGFSFDTDTIELTDIAKATLNVTTTAASTPGSHTLAVRGTDASGRSTALCLQLEERRTGDLRLVTDIERPQKSSRTLEIILDLSGSMKLPLGRSTRIATARQVLRDVLAKIPDDFSVGLRLYGHRYGSREKRTCTDTELVVPLQKLDRQRLLAVVDNTQPRGETPLVYSMLQTPADLKAAGGGSVILITDGEESCGGDLKAAARQLKDSGVEVSIVGFTLKAKQVEQQLSALADATGGRYYSAQSGEALGRALLVAAIDSMPFTVLDADGKEIVRGTSAAPVELPPGDYKVVVQAGDQQLVAEGVRISARGNTTIRVALKGDRFELVR